VRKRPGKAELDARVPGLRLECWAQGAFAYNKKDNGRELRGGEGLDEKIEAVPLHQPAGESEDEGIGWDGQKQWCRRGGRDRQFFLGDGVWENQDAIGGNAVSQDATLEVRRDDDNEAGAAEEDAVRPSGKAGEEGLSADARVADDFINLDHEGAAVDGGDEGGGEEEEGVALVDEVAIVAARKAEVSSERGEIVEEFEELEKTAREPTAEAREECSGARLGERGGAGGLAGIDAGGA
jgi:hypothetical protein